MLIFFGGLISGLVSSLASGAAGSAVSRAIGPSSQQSNPVVPPYVVGPPAPVNPKGPPRMRSSHLSGSTVRNVTRLLRGV